MSLEVLEAGWATRIVDAGRPNARRFGVPVGGAADRAALAIGNALVGNAPGIAALEICLRGPRLRALGDVACVVYGAPFVLTGPRRAPAPGSTFTLRAGEELHVGGTPHAMRAYLCVRGGFEVPAILGSHSALACLRPGETLQCATGTIRGRFVRAVVPRLADRQTLRVLPGLQASWFCLDELYQQDFVVRPESDRMGLRLRGAPLKLPDRELVSEAVGPGAVQVTRDGQCIVLGVDGQTIGGYPKVAHVVQADLDWVGQLRPGQTVRFAPVQLAEAVTIFRQQQTALRQWVLRLQASLGES